MATCCLNRAQRQAMGTPGSALGGWKPRGSSHARIGSREAIFYDDDAEAKATPFPSTDRWAAIFDLIVMRTSRQTRWWQFLGFVYCIGGSNVEAHLSSSDA